MMSIGRRLDGCGNFLKYSLFTVNLIILLGGLIVAALGLWTVIDRSFPNELLGTNLYAGASYVLVITGFLVSFISCFGCFGAVKEVRCMLVTYFIALFVIFVTMLIGGILAYVFREKVEITLANGMYGSLKDYGNYRPVTYAWDETQARLMCCGVNNYRDWRDSIPDSCCKPVLGRRQRCNLLVENQNSFTLYTRGCLQVTKQYVKDHAIIIGSGGIVVACLTLYVRDSVASVSFLYSWPKSRVPPQNVQTGRNITAAEFYLFYSAVNGVLLIAALGWSIRLYFLYDFLEFNPKGCYFAVPSAIICFSSFWIVQATHSDTTFFKYLPVIAVCVIFSNILLAVGAYIGSSYKIPIQGLATNDDLCKGSKTCISHVATYLALESHLINAVFYIVVFIQSCVGVTVAGIYVKFRVCK